MAEVRGRVARFVEAKKRGMNGADAAVAAGYKDGPGAAVTASRLMKKPEVRAALGLGEEKVRRRHSKSRGRRAREQKTATTTAAAGTVAAGSEGNPPLTEEELLASIRDDPSQPASQRIKAADRLRELREQRELAEAEARAAEAPPEADEDPYGVVLLCNGRGPDCGMTPACVAAHFRKLSPEQRGEVFEMLGLRVVSA